MRERLTNLQVSQFLNDVKNNSETYILEEGKEKDELLQVAKARGLDIENSRDLALFKTIYAFTDKPNANGAILPKKELLKVLPQIVGKPVNRNHERDAVLGHYIEYKYIEKESKIIAYGVFYKSYYPELYDLAQDKLQLNKLSSSFEIWSPKDSQKENADGTYELRKMEMAGGALIFEDSENEPAFKDAKVLQFANKNIDNVELVFAKYKTEEIITADVEQTKQVEQQTVTVNKITCSNCAEPFEIGGLDANIKCPKCFAILNHEGQMIYPPQIKDFSLLCPGCNVNSWLIISNSENKSKVRCMGCAKEYDITFKVKKEHDNLKMINFLYSGTARCYQCNNTIVFAGLSKTKTRELTCSRCGLVFTHNINESNKYRTIASIQEIEAVKKTDKEIVKSSEEGGNEMELNDKKEEVVEKTTEEKVEEKIEEVKVETTETPAEESSLEEAPKAEVKVEEPKAEEKIEEPKEEVKDDVSPVDIEFEKQFEKEAEYDITISKIVKLVKTAHTLEVASEHKTLSKEERKSLSDSMFAVVITATNRKTGKVRKVRMYPMVDEAHIKYALKQLASKEIRDNLIKLGAKYNDIRKKVIKRARKLNLKKLAESLKEEKVKTEKIKAGVNKTVKQLIEARKQVELYKANAKEILKRRAELDKFDTDLTDEDILNDEKFEKAKTEKQNVLLKSSKEEDNIVSSNTKDNDYYAKYRKEIDEKAFGKAKE